MDPREGLIAQVIAEMRGFVYHARKFNTGIAPEDLERWVASLSSVPVPEAGQEHEQGASRVEDSQYGAQSGTASSLWAIRARHEARIAPKQSLVGTCDKCGHEQEVPTGLQPNGVFVCGAWTCSQCGGNLMMTVWADTIGSPTPDDDIAALLVMLPTWQPISTAPKDGPPFLVYWRKSITGRESIDLVGPEEYQEIIGYGEPPAEAWMPLPLPPLPAAGRVTAARPPDADERAGEQKKAP